MGLLLIKIYGFEKMKKGRTNHSTRIQVVD